MDQWHHHHGAGTGEPPTILRLSSDDALPIPLEELKLDLRVDDDDEDDTLKRNMLTAAAMIEVRSGAIIQRGTFEALFNACTNPIEVRRFPLRQITSIAAMTAKNDWTEIDVGDFRVLQLDKHFALRPFPGYVSPTFFIPDLSFRVQFTAGYGEAESGESEGEEIPLPDLYRGALTAITGSLFENRELGLVDAQFKTEQSMAGLLNSIRTFW